MQAFLLNQPYELSSPHQLHKYNSHWNLDGSSDEELGPIINYYYYSNTEDPTNIVAPCALGIRHSKRQFLPPMSLQYK